MKGRNGYIELLRLFGAVGIVYFHMGGPYGWVGHSALIVFIIVSVIFASTSLTPAWKRTRVLKIWIFWSAIYVILKGFQATTSGQPIFSEFTWWMLLTGPVLPLWFLPFIFFACAVAQKYLEVSPRPSAIEATLLCLALMLCVGASQLSLPIPIPQWTIGIGASVTAVTVIRAKTNPLYISIFFLGLTILYLKFGLPEVRIYLVGLLLCSLAFNWLPHWESQLANSLGSLSLGLYVLHPGVAAVVGQFLPELGLPSATAIVLLASLALTQALKKLPYAGKYV